MTMPHLMNCPHSPDSWCLDCVYKLWHEKNDFEVEIKEWQDFEAKTKQMIDGFEVDMVEIKQIIQEWLDKQGHDRCWYYPDLFKKLADKLELKTKVEANLPPRSEFELGCQRYQQEQFGEKNE